MDAVRDLGRTEPWEKSLERSRARRNKPSDASIKRNKPQLERRATPGTPPRRPPSERTRAHRPGAMRSRICVVGIFAVASAVVVLLSSVAGRGTQTSPIAAQARTLPAAPHDGYAASTGAGPLARWPALRVIEAGQTRACQPYPGESTYVNPLGGARVRPERIDQGVDYAGSGPLAAIGAARVTYVATAATGWPGSFLEYRLLEGPDAGCYVYYAEGVQPVAGLRVGQTVATGERIASIISGWPTGIELGWAAGVSTATYAAETHQWSATRDENSVPSAAGRSFSALIASLGGPSGKVEG